MPNIRDVARACGVSPMTVSFVLNNKPGQVSEQTRARVLQVIREMGYRPTTGKDENSDTKKAHTLGVVAGTEGGSLSSLGYHGRIFKWLLVAAEESVHNLMVFPYSLLHENVTRAMRSYCDGRCDGLIIISPHFMSELLVTLKERGFPFVGISHLTDDPSVTCVDIDNWDVAARAVRHLFECGHRRIGFVEARFDIQSSRQRREGFLREMHRLHLEVDPKNCWLDSGGREEPLNNAMRIANLKKEERPTAFFCWNDSTALRYIEAFSAAGLRVPQDISVIGVDDDEPSVLSGPPLTTFRQPYEQISRTALKLLVEHIEDRSLPPQTIFHPVELIERGSVMDIK